MPPDVPDLHRAFLDRALPLLQADARILGLAAGGSWITAGLDDFSDLDLVVAVEDEAFDAVMEDRRDLAGRLGPLLVSFTGEHVGEPRLLICLYGPPLLHVDLKFVKISDFGRRIEDPEILWERSGKLAAAMRARAAEPLRFDPQWVEDRFWAWVHYQATKIGRGELLEAAGGQSIFLNVVVGPMAVLAEGCVPRAARRLETLAPRHAARLREVLCAPEREACLHALRRTIALYRELRGKVFPPGIQRHEAAELETERYLDAVERKEGQL